MKPISEGYGERDSQQSAISTYLLTRFNLLQSYEVCLGLLFQRSFGRTREYNDRVRYAGMVRESEMRRDTSPYRV